MGKKEENSDMGSGEGIVVLAVEMRGGVTALVVRMHGSRRTGLQEAEV